MIKIETLGKFQMADTDHVLRGEDIRSQKMTKLLLYMMLHRNQTLTLDETVQAIWQEDEIQNPAGALKNLMYRLRGMLKHNFGEEEYLLTGAGFYCWNPDVLLVIDVEEFEKKYDAAKKQTSEQRKRQYLEEAIVIYQGNFMQQIAEMHWVAALGTYYHSIYLAAVNLLSELYLKENLYSKLETVCSQAIQMDHLEEELYYFLILAQMKQNQIPLAIETYEKACNVLEEELGIRKPQKLGEIYDELLTKMKSDKAECMSVVKEGITEKNPNGVFVCGYPVFREIYRYEARKKGRSSEAEHILLLTIFSETEQNEKMGEFRIKNAMIHLEKTLRESLRLGDAVSRYSNSQYVILLPACSYESGKMVAERIVSKFYHENKKYRSLKIKTSLRAVEMAEREFHKEEM